LADESCDGLVEMESDYESLIGHFPNVSFVKKEERGKTLLLIFFLFGYNGFVDPYKGTPRRSTAGQPVGFLFGSPSNRFPVNSDYDYDYDGEGLIEERENEEEGDDIENDQ
jgi:hypothetical protein